MSRAWPAYEALVMALRGINGNPDFYHTDLAGRVYADELLPDEHPEIERPYVFVIALPRAGQESAGRHIKITYRWLIVGVVSDQDGGDPLSLETVRAVCGLEDDIRRVILRDPTLGKTVHDCEVTSSDVVPKMGDVQVVEVEVEAKVWVGEDSLKV